LAEVLYSSANLVILEELSVNRYDSREWFDLKLMAENLSLLKGFTRLISIEHLPIDLYDHQKQAALQVLRNMRGRAILADEVGLGKTIEAGVILKEYMLRGLVQSVLILVPANLVKQWKKEMEEKFGLEFLDVRGPSHWKRSSLVVGSLDMAKREEHAQNILEQNWDMVIVDEAHRMKSASTQNWKFVNAVKKKFLLLLTATPVQNDLKELYNLVTLLKPGQLKTYSSFKKEFIIDKHSPKNIRHLRELLDEVMVRTTRRQTLLHFPKRQVFSLSVPLTGPERQFYQRIISILKKSFITAPQVRRNLLPYILLLRETTSHPKAAMKTLMALWNNESIPGITSEDISDLNDLSGKIVPGKLKLVKQLVNKNQSHILIFTGFKETLKQVCQALSPENREIIPFHGGLDEIGKQQAISRFRREKSVLVSTETGGEGLNLQFCPVVINYDLPWNPLRLEQRIGRVHRLGQKQDVTIYNLVAEETIESYLLYLLDKKINMFQKVVGELEEILLNVYSRFEHTLAEAVLLSVDDEDLSKRIEAFGHELEEATQLYSRQVRLTDTLFVLTDCQEASV
jgi:SNF2 family DNA or RNA helicase